MKSGTPYALLRVDGKGRVHLPAELRKEMGIEGQVLVKREKGSLVLKPIRKIGDPVEFLSSLSVKTRKSPAEMKREAEQAFGG